MKEGHCKCWAGALIITGIVLVLVRLYTLWDIWVVIGAILVVKGISKLVMPNCCCQAKADAKKKK